MMIYPIHPPRAMIKSGKFNPPDKKAKTTPQIVGIKLNNQLKPNQKEYLISLWHCNLPCIEQSLQTIGSFHMQIL